MCGDPTTPSLGTDARLAMASIFSSSVMRDTRSLMRASSGRSGLRKGLSPLPAWGATRAADMTRCEAQQDKHEDGETGMMCAHGGAIVRPMIGSCA